MFNIVLTPGNDKKKLNDAYNKNREELRNNPQGVLDVIFANKDRGAPPRQSPENPDIEAGAREVTPENFATPRTEFSKRTEPRTEFSKRLDMAAGGVSDDEQISNAINEMVNENDISQMDAVDSDDENTEIRNARNEMTNIYVGSRPELTTFSLGDDTSAITDSDVPKLNQSGMFLNDSDTD